MIYWTAKPDTEYTIAFPLAAPVTDAEKDHGNFLLTIRNNVGRWNITGYDWDWDATPGWLYVSGRTPLDPDAIPPEGEYTYEARLEVPAPDHPEDYTNRVISTGLMVFGDYLPEREQYDDNKTEYEQYD
jgi:hypothetical protein